MSLYKESETHGGKEGKEALWGRNKIKVMDGESFKHLYPFSHFAILHWKQPLHSAISKEISGPINVSLQAIIFMICLTDQ